MTQKELLYFEDAIGHEGNIIKICEETIKSLNDESLISFMENELSVHVSLRDELMTMLEEKVNE